MPHKKSERSETLRLLSRVIADYKLLKGSFFTCHVPMGNYLVISSPCISTTGPPKIKEKTLVY